MALSPAEITTVEACAAEIEELAAELRHAHTRDEAQEDWTGEESTKADYDRLIALAREARAIVAECGSAT